MKKYHILMMFLMLAGMGMMTSCGGDDDNGNSGKSGGSDGTEVVQSPAEWIIGTWKGSKGKAQYRFTFNAGGKGSGTVTDQYNIRTNYTFSSHFNGSAAICEAVATHVVPSDPTYVDTPVGVELEFMIVGQSLVFEGVTLNK